MIASGPDQGWTDVLEWAQNVISTTVIDAGYIVNNPVDARIALENIPSLVFPGATIGWTLRVEEGFGVQIGSLRVQSPVPTGIGSATWQCTATGGATCPSTGNGAVDLIVAMPVGGALRFDLSGQVLAGHHPVIATTATATVLGGQTDFRPADNQVSLQIPNDRLFANGFQP